MKKHLLLLVAIVLAVGTLHAQFANISPVPGSKFHNPETIIILRGENTFDESTVRSGAIFSVTGSLSGKHSARVKVADGGKIINLVPDVPFSYGETVTVTIGEGLKALDGKNLSGTSFTFDIKRAFTDEEKNLISVSRKEIDAADFPRKDHYDYALKGGPESGFPDFTIVTNTAPGEGEVFFSQFDIFGDGGDPHYCIIESDGDSVFGKYDTVNYNNFELNRNGYMTVYNDHDSSFVMIDSNYYVIDTFQMLGGYIADVHEFQIFPDGSRWMICYDPQYVDMTVYHPSYNPNALVYGLVIQKIDANNNLLFEWRSWDHFEITEADHVILSGAVIDYVHANAIEFEDDGTILLCSRHLSEITKINTNTGNIVWRWGGPSNEFTFINDADGMSYQHDIKRLSNGNVILFDNGNYHAPPRSSAKEYILDEVNKTATLVWSYYRPFGSGSVFSKAMGSAHRLPNGNTLICWGLVIGQTAAPSLTEVDAAGNIVWEMEINSPDAIYRARRYEWSPCARPSLHTVKATKITANSARIKWSAATNATRYSVQYRPQGSSTWTTKGTENLAKKINNLTPSTVYEYRVKSKCDNIATQSSGFTAIKTFTTAPLRAILNEEMEAPVVSVFPNPASESVQVQFMNGKDEEAVITIYDLTGKIVFQTNPLQEREGSYQLDISSLPSGIYMIGVKTASGGGIEKLVKQ